MGQWVSYDVEGYGQAWIEPSGPSVAKADLR